MGGRDFNHIYSINYVFIMHISIYFLLVKDSCKESFILIILVFFLILLI